MRAFDKDNGKVLWEKPMAANFAGIPAVYEARGKQYVAFFGGCCEKPDAGVAKHVEYSLTWFALAAALGVLWTVFAFKRVQ